jgi:hypothetical protein
MIELFPLRFSLPVLLVIFTAGVIPVAANAQQPSGSAETQPLCKEQCEKDCMGNDTPTERAKCLEREKCGERPACPSKGSGAWISIDRGIGKGAVKVKCADADSTKQCLDAVSTVISPGEGTTAVVYATSSIKCGSTTYEVSNGIDGGSCQTAGSSGGSPNNIVKCTDNKGNDVASADCTSGCGSTTNKGSCTIK